MNRPFRRYIRLSLRHALAGLVLAGFYLVWLMNDSPLRGIGLLSTLLYLWLIFGLGVYLLWSRFLAPRLVGYSKRERNLWLLGCLLAGFWLADNIPILLPGAGISKVLYFLASGAGTGLLLYGLSIFLATPIHPGGSPVKRRLRWLVFALPMIALWSIYLLAYWPGMMSADSLDQWGQALSGQFIDHHPAFHTFTIWLLTRLVETPAAVALAQIVALALVTGAILAHIESLGVASHWVWAACLLFALTPVNGTMVVTLWKDIPYATVMLALTYLIFRLAQSRGKWIESTTNWLALGVIAALAGLFRHNGLLAVLATFPVLLVALRRYWKQLVYAFGLSMVLYFGITGPVYGWAGVEKSSLLVDSTTSLYVIAASADSGSQAEALLQSMDPLSNDWSCSIISSLYQANRDDPPGNPETLALKAQKLAANALRLAAYNYRCNRSLVWIIWDPNGELRNPSHAGYWIDPNPYGILPASRIPGLNPWQRASCSGQPITPTSTGWCGARRFIFISSCWWLRWLPCARKMPGFCWQQRQSCCNP
jgi:hypothetical protein